MTETCEDCGLQRDRRRRGQQILDDDHCWSEVGRMDDDCARRTIARLRSALDAERAGAGVMRSAISLFLDGTPVDFSGGPPWWPAAGRTLRRALSSSAGAHALKVIEAARELEVRFMALREWRAGGAGAEAMNAATVGVVEAVRALDDKGGTNG